MSVTAWLQQVSESGLEVIKNDLETFESVIWLLTPKNTDIPLISDLSELTSEQIELLAEITLDANEICNYWTGSDAEVLEELKQNSPQHYERLKTKLFSIVMSEKNCSDLDFGKDWDWVSYILRDGRSMDRSSCTYKSDTCYSANIFSGKPLNPKDVKSGILYQEISEVIDISQVLLDIDDMEIRRRFEQASRMNPFVYRGGWLEEFYPLLLEYCTGVRFFYQTAANQGFGVINAIS